MNDKNCGRCRFFSHLECRRHAPVYVAESTSRSAYPRTSTDEWCGDWELQPDPDKRWPRDEPRAIELKRPMQPWPV